MRYVKQGWFRIEEASASTAFQLKDVWTVIADIVDQSAGRA